MIKKSMDIYKKTKTILAAVDLARGKTKNYSVVVDITGVIKYPSKYPSKNK